MGLLDFASSVINSISGHKSQQKAMKHGIQWRVMDANAAGIHPLYAMGAQLPMYSPTSSINFGDMGQDISRARMATRDAKDRAAELERSQWENSRNAKLEDTRFALDIERAGLENELLRSQIGRLNSAQIGPPVPSYSAPSPRFQPRASDPVIGSESDPSREPGNVVDYAYSRLPNGNLAIVPSADMKQRMEDMPLQEWPWTFRNNIVPFFDRDRFPPPDTREFPNRPGYHWHFNGTEFVERRNNPRPARRRSGRRQWPPR